jgi:branched-subunit amino acid aminotransferase/4-amino-4-deoxychorismate lyase
MSESLRVQLNGRAATVDELAAGLLGGHGHFTAMQVRQYRTRGLDFHFTRLDAATKELFGVGLSAERVRGYLREALGANTPDASVRVNVFKTVTPGASEPQSIDPEVSVLVSVRPPYGMPSGPLSLRTVPYQRPFAHLKHVGGFAQGRYLDLVSESGFDEALLVDHDGTVSEGAITNIAFVSGESVIWPDAPMLHGIAMQVLERELAKAHIPSLRRRVTVDDLASFDGAFVTNSRGIAAVGRIDELDVPVDAPLLAKVLSLFDAAPWDAL